MTSVRALIVVAGIGLAVGAGALLVLRSPEAEVGRPLSAYSAVALLRPDSTAVLPAAPIDGRIGPAAVWTGSEMVLWGGSGVDDGSRSDGAAFDPLAGDWRVLSDAPIEGRGHAATVWTGTEMIVWGGNRDGVATGDGAAYDPTTDGWRALPAAPLGPASRPTAVWTGSEMIVLSGLDGDESAAAYDPTADHWRQLADTPGSPATPLPHAVWTGEAVLTPIATDGSSAIAMFRPGADGWELVGPLPPDRFLVAVPGVELGMAGDEVVAVTAAAGDSLPVLDVFGDVGTDLDGRKRNDVEVDLWHPIWTGHEILIWSGGDRGVALDPLKDEWREFPAGDLDRRTDAAIVWADGVMLAWGGAVEADDGSTTAASDGVAYRPVDPPAVAPPATTVAPIDTRTGCPNDHPGSWRPGSDGFTDYADSVRLAGRFYDRSQPADLSTDQLGELVGIVCFTLEKMTFDGDAPIQDGDATFLPVGTELRAIPGGDPSLRVGAVTPGGVIVYEVTYVEDAAIGADLIDLTAPIVEIGVNDEYSEQPITSITDPTTITTLIDLLAGAPVDLSPRPSSNRDGRRYFIQLIRADGTSTSRSFWIETGELWPGIDLPTEWRTNVEDALAAAG